MATPSPIHRDDRLDSWKEIATYLNRDIRTVQRWEKVEGLPVHRHLHEKQSSVHAFKSELDQWRAARAAQPTAPNHSNDHRKWLLLAIPCAALLYWQLKPAPTPPLQALPFTTYPGDERNPTFSPDGSQVAFAWNKKDQSNFDLYIKQVGGPDEPLRLTNTSTQEISPAWSPDGRHLAYLEVQPSGQAKLMLIPVLGGQSPRELSTTYIRRLDDAYSYLTWTRDSKQIVYCHRSHAEQPCALHVLSIDGNHRRTLTSPSSTYAGDLEPTFSPDGNTLLFSRIQQVGVEDLFTLPFDGNSPATQLTNLSIAGAAAWLPRNQGILFSAGDYRGTRHLWNTKPGGQPTKITSIGEDAVNIAATNHNGQTRLVYSKEILDENIWQLDLKSRHSELLLASTRADYNPNISPDSSRITFVSNRSGNSEIWTAAIDGSKPVQLTSFAGKLTSNPKWSPDGQRIVFDSRVGDGQPRVYLINANGGNQTRLTEEPASEPTWSRDGQWIYFTADSKGRREIWKIRPDGSGKTQVTTTGASYSMESTDGKFLLYAAAQYPRPVSLYRMPTNGGTSEKVLDTLERYLNFAPAPDGIYFAENRGNGTVSLSFYRYSSKSIQPILVLDKPLSFGLSLSPDFTRLFFSTVDQQGSDLMLVENFR